MNLSDRALLVQLSISQWSARKYDRKASKQVADANHASANAGRYNKALMPMNGYLEDVHSKSNTIRAVFYNETLPWGLEGMQILPTANYLNFMTEFRKHKGEWEYLVNLFFDNYERLRDEAKTNLGDLYNPLDYPALDDMRKKFNMDLAVFPVPATDFRVQIGNDELSRIQQDIERRVQDAQLTAMRDVWQRLFDRVKHIAEKCADPKAIFRDSMMENARELCDLLPRLNLTDDPNLERLRQEVESKLIHHPDALRNNPDLRRDTATEAKKIMDAMGVFMGAN